MAISDHDPGAEALSDLIGAIYDCAIDPSRWDATLGRISGLLDCTACGFIFADPHNMTTLVQHTAGFKLEWDTKFAADAAEMIVSVPDLMTRPLDEPFVGHNDISEGVRQSNRYWREWVSPQGFIDFIALRLLKNSRGFKDVTFMRHEDIGLITEREIRLMRLLAPHVRRTVTISDLMDIKSLETGPLTDTLDAFAAGVVLVARDATIIHANRAAADMLGGSGPVFSTRGRLRAADARTTAKLRRIVAASARRDADIGAEGIGMALSRRNGDVGMAHVLPLANGDLRTRLEPGATAAVFVGSSEISSVGHIGGFAEAFGLSPAEARVLARLVLGESTGEAARALGIAVPTVKTHLSRILGKTGARRQTDLLTLVHRLAPSVNVNNHPAAS